MKKQAQPPGQCWPLICIVGALVISGCDAVGPNYKRPEVEVPTAFKSATAPETAPGQLQPNWWTLFGDAELNELEAQAIKANYTLQAAMANVEQARAAASQVKSAFYPNISFDPTVIRSRTSANVASASGGGAGPTRNLTNTTYTAPFDLSYEVDLWGQVRRAVEASNAQVQFSLDEYEVVLQTLEADLAQDYFTLHFYDAQYATLTESVDTFRKQLELTQTEFRAGLLGAADVASAEAQLEATITQQVDASRQRPEEEFAIAVLLNRPPSAFSLPVQPLMAAPPVMPAGLPADLLRRRPHVAAAEQNLAYASAQIGVAISQFYPQLTLTGDAGFESLKASNLLDWQSRIWSLGPSVTLPLFNGGRLQAQVDQEKALYNQYLAQYQTQVLTAYQDVENALTDLHTRADEAKAQTAAVSASAEYVRLTELQFRQGLVAYLDVLDADRTLLTNQLLSEQILNERLVSTVLLIKALGGGWDSSAPMEKPSP